MVAFGYWERPTHASPKVPQVTATFSALHDQSPLGQMPSWLSLEHAWHMRKAA